VVRCAVSCRRGRRARADSRRPWVGRLECARAHRSVAPTARYDLYAPPDLVTASTSLSTSTRPTRSTPTPTTQPVRLLRPVFRVRSLTASTTSRLYYAYLYGATPQFAAGVLRATATSIPIYAYYYLSTGATYAYYAYDLAERRTSKAACACVRAQARLLVPTERGLCPIDFRPGVKRRALFTR